MERKFTTPHSEIQTAKILAESARALDPEFADLYDEGLMLAWGAVKTMPEHITNPRLSMLWKAKIAIGRLLISREVKEPPTFDEYEAERIWNQLMGH